MSRRMLAKVILWPSHSHTCMCAPPHRVHLHTHELMCIHRRISAHIDNPLFQWSEIWRGSFHSGLFFFFWPTTDLPSRGGRGANHSPLFCALSSPGIWGELSSPTCVFVPGPKQSEKGLPTLGTFRRLGERLKNSLGCQLFRASSAGRGAWALSRQDRGTSGTTRGSYSLIWTPETALP